MLRLDAENGNNGKRVQREITHGERQGKLEHNSFWDGHLGSPSELSHAIHRFGANTFEMCEPKT
jgi:hypothetical protein